ncbi:MAG: hypothetical protein J1F39_07270, partial [Clostridiales bacterium]|nr:hypothetical protein [Clostridiales bacterium]
MNKNEILANMYALRAGLSAVAVSGDKINKKITAAKKQAADSEKKARTEKQNALDSISRIKASKKIAEDGLARSKDGVKNAKKANAKAAGNSVKYAVINILKFVLGLALAVFFLYVLLLWIASIIRWTGNTPGEFLTSLYSWSFTDSGDTSSFEWIIFVMIAVSALGIAAAVFGVRIIIAVVKDGIFIRPYFIKRGKSAQSEKKFIDLIDKANRDIEQVSASLPDCDKKINKAIADGKALVEKTRKELAPQAAATVELYKALQVTFSDMLDERDWENLDLITYYLETGRADTVKEALQLLDRQKQTNQIVAAVKEAAGVICQTVKTGLTQLKSYMDVRFNDLSSKIASVSSQVGSIGSRISTVEGAIASQNSQIAQIASTTNLNNALLERQNDTSAQLVAYARQI